MSYHHLSTYERGRIEALNKLGLSNRVIARQLGRHRSCIDREIRRNTIEVGYQAEDAQENYQQRRRHSRPKGKWDEGLANCIQQRLRETWSPEQIANTKTLARISFKTIYRWLYQGKLPQVTISVLRQKGKRLKPAEKRGKFAMGTSISERPKEVKSRKTSGHWELDTIVSSRGESKGCFATFVERKSRSRPRKCLNWKSPIQAFLHEVAHLT